LFVRRDRCRLAATPADEPDGGFRQRAAARSPSLNADLEFRRRGFALDNGVFTTIDATDPAPRHFDL
jgi:hypothetical protein